jgi:hypothetical protein
MKMVTLRGFPNPPAMGSIERSSLAPDAIKDVVEHAGGRR